MSETTPARRKAYRILFLSSAHPAKDKRVFDKEALSLSAAGFVVTHLAPGDPGEEIDQDVRLVMYKKPQGLVARMLAIPRLIARARKITTDCYHCNEVDSWLAGVFLKFLGPKGRRAALVFDAHEMYPAHLAEYHFPPLFRPLVVRAVLLLYRALYPFTDRIVFARQSVMPDFHKFTGETVVVENFPPLAGRSEIKRSSPAGSGREAPTLIHIGNISKARGWPQLLDAMALLKDSKVRLKIIGLFSDRSESDFHTVATRLGLAERITALEWMPFDNLFAELQKADVGLVLFQPGYTNFVHGMPHKLFDYMMAELPVIIPDFTTDVKEIVKRAGCGMALDVSDPKALAEGIDSVLADPGQAAAMGALGRAAVESEYNWESQAAKLVAMYSHLESEK